MKKKISMESTDPQALLNQIVSDYIKTKKHNAVWRWIKSIAFLSLIIVATYAYISAQHDEMLARAKPHIGLVEISGAIADTQQANSEDFIDSLEKAYASKSLKALLLKIDSPGGSPVQADDMYHAVRHYRDKYPDIKTYAVCVDACMSAAYYVATAAEKIYANQSSLVGSIGVIYNGFGFVDSLQKVGATRRLMSAGINKGFLDPFLPMETAQVEKLQGMLDIIHQQFINSVKQGRGDRLAIDDDTFSGLFWTGIQAKERGLIDGFGSTSSVARDIIKLDDVVDYTYRQSILTQLSKNIGASVAAHLPKSLGLVPSVSM